MQCKGFSAAVDVVEQRTADGVTVAVGIYDREIEFENKIAVVWRRGILSSSPVKGLYGEDE